jgi:hypothetical protein
LGFGISLASRESSAGTLRLLLPNCFSNLFRGPRLQSVWAFAGEELIKKYAEGIDIA